MAAEPAARPEKARVVMSMTGSISTYLRAGLLFRRASGILASS
jgi:hypothetical protein